MSSDALDAPRPWRTLRATGIAVAAVALTGLFMLLGFPYDRVADRLAARIERETGTRIALGPVSVGLVRWAPGLESEPVHVERPDGSRYELERVGVRPALALSWLFGRPALALEIASAQGDVRGVTTLGTPRSFDGRLANLDLAGLPQERLGAGLQLSGRADADVDLVFAEEGPAGSVSFEALEGTVAHPQIPLPMPYEKLSGEIDLGGDTTAEIRELVLESPLATGRATGSIGRAATLPTSPLRLQIELTVSGPVRGSLNAQGVQVGHFGQVRLNISGTVGRPVVQ